MLCYMADFILKVQWPRKKFRYERNFVGCTCSFYKVYSESREKFNTSELNKAYYARVMYNNRTKA